jgi:hypothetical protein
VEVGVKTQADRLDLSCVVKTDEYSTLVASTVVASQPRLIRYIANNIQNVQDLTFDITVPGVEIKSVGADEDSYLGLLAEIERPGREGPIVLVSPTKDGEYLLEAEELQQRLIGLAQVVKVSGGTESGFDLAAMATPLNLAPDSPVKKYVHPTSEQKVTAVGFEERSLI